MTKKTRTLMSGDDIEVAKIISVDEDTWGVEYYINEAPKQLYYTEFGREGSWGAPEGKLDDELSVYLWVTKRGHAAAPTGEAL